MKKALALCAALAALAIAPRAFAQAAPTQNDGVYLTTSGPPYVPFAFALIAKGASFEQGNTAEKLTRRFDLSSPFTIVAQSSSATHISLVIEVVKKGQRTARVEASGVRVTGTILSDGQPRVSAF